MPRKIIQVQEKVPLAQWFPLSLQHMFAMFGASILVPSIFLKDDPNKAGVVAAVLLMNGIGTLLFILLTKGKAPAYLGSSFSFIQPTLTILGTTAYAGFAYRAALGGFVAVGLVGIIVALIIWKFGTKWISVVLPAAAMGPVVALIGLTLAGAAVDNFGHLISHNNVPVDPRYVYVFLITLGFAIIGSVCFKKFFSVIPILIAIIAGYVSAVLFHLVDFSAVGNASWFALPYFQTPVFKWDAIIVMLPALLVLTTEHIGHQLVTSEIVGKDLLKDPGLHRSMLGDYISTTISGLVGAVPTTTYGENIGVMAITKVYSVWVIGGAAVISAVISLIGKVSAFISTIPDPVIGGVSFLLYGMIAAAGIRVMVDAKVDYSKSRNLVLTAVVFITGLSGVSISIGTTPLSGLPLATIVGMLLSLLFFAFDKLHLTNDVEEANEKAATK